jgi:hypothetical protein
MPNTKHDPHRLELVKAGKLEERHSVRRPSIIPKQEEAVDEPDKDVSRLRPELVAIAIMVIVLIVLTVVGF